MAAEVPLVSLFEATLMVLTGFQAYATIRISEAYQDLHVGSIVANHWIFGLDLPDQTAFSLGKCVAGEAGLVAAQDWGFTRVVGGMLMMADPGC